MIEANLEQVRQRIAAAARLKGRDPAGVRLIAVTKGVPVERIREAIACGVREIGENRVQEAQQKQPAIGREVRRHLIGHLQRNKVKVAVELFDVIHSVDSPELIEALERAVVLRQSLPPTRSGAQDERGEQIQDERGLDLLVQVNVSGEATKHGCKPDEARVLAEAVLKSKNLKLSGFMTMAPFADDPESARPVFRELRRLRDEINPSLDLSMGMSQDFEAAVEEGATLVRIGTAIFQ